MSVSPGRRFMIDLLVSSLMADGGLESALNAAITAEIQVSPRCFTHQPSPAQPFRASWGSLGRMRTTRKPITTEARVQFQPCVSVWYSRGVCSPLPFQDIEAKKEAQKEKEIDEQEANASSMQRCRTALDKDLINTGIYESAGKQSLPLVQLVQQLLRYLPTLPLGPSTPPLSPSLLSLLPLLSLYPSRSEGAHV